MSSLLRSRKRTHKRGVALVVVLASLVFLTVLTVAFVASIGTELKSSRRFADGVSTQFLSQSAYNLASSQITEATKGYEGTDVNTPLAWASQPGMIRTYTTTGDKARFYRLYSWDKLSDNGTYAPDDLTGWFDQKAVFVDLNEPISADGVARYPIVDGNLQDMTVAAYGGPVKTYNTDSLPTAPDIEGFYVKGAPTAPSASATSTPNTVPMPVKWLYVLANGKVVAPTSISSTEARVPDATGDNPIVGRMAYWTDDETCKININTASEGTYWDAPRTFSVEDYALSQKQPAQREFQRYPGHPAMTSLRTVFPTLSAEEIYAISPRVVGGGSMSGTVALPLTPTVDQSLPYGSDRLYASVDELIFKPTLDGATIPSRQENKSDVLTRDTLEKSRFFLTATSRAPDLNLFNKPRISLWPITLDPVTGTPTRTPFDQVLSFCATINRLPYYIQRQYPASSTQDLPAMPSTTGLGRNRMLLEYLRSLTSLAIPGFGGTFAAKYNAAATYPGSGPATDRDQILTQIFDYIRCTNLRDSTLGASWAGQYTKNLATGYATNTSMYKAEPGIGQVTPIEDTTTGTRGFGRFHTVQSAFLQFIGNADSTTNPADTGTAPNVVPKVEAGKIRVLTGFFVQMFDPSQGQVLNKHWYTVEVEGLDKFEWGPGEFEPTRSMGFPAKMDISRPSPGAMTFNNFFGGMADYRAFFYNPDKPYPLLSARTGYPDQSPDFGPTFYFKGGDVTIRIYQSDNKGKATTTVLQTLTLNFPSQTFPSPALAPNDVGYKDAYGTNVGPYNYREFEAAKNGRLGADQTLTKIHSQDLIRAVVATPGDMRLIAPLKVVPNSLYAKHRLYGAINDSAIDPALKNRGLFRFAYNSRCGMGFPYYGASGGKLVNLAYPGYASQYNQPTVNDRGIYISYGGTNPRDVEINPASFPDTGVTQSNGAPADWDNGIGNLRDGSYINKADEGDNGIYGSSVKIPYFSLNYTIQTSLPGPTFFSPNRLIPSAVMLGSLPTGVFANKAWQTLLFRPGPERHLGLGSPVNTPVGPPYVTPPDHLLLDLFNMPVVEPYAISEPLSTAGRINMNYQIVPFTYINRETGLRAVLKAEKLLSIPDANASLYKTTASPEYAPAASFATTVNRQPLDADATLLQFRQRFAANDIFRSASEICSIDLVPADAPAATRAAPTRNNMDSYWASHKLTGDNTREKPYANIYPRLTTKSNTFTIYTRAQTLKKVKGSTQDIWTEGKDVITGEYRGSQTMERYIDPNDPSIEDYANTATTHTPISTHYKTRVIASKHFAP
ncbi:MAG: Verru_Chthon cassette protein A [Candidatus Methylacidiphilales bacterium]